MDKDVFNRANLYAIDTNGIMTTYDTAAIVSGGIAVESFALIPANQDLYCVDAGQSQLMKISRTALANYVGGLMIAQTATSGYPGLPIYSPAAKIFIVAWDSVNSAFKVKAIKCPPDFGTGYGGSSAIFEDITFAPLNLPSQ